MFVFSSVTILRECVCISVEHLVRCVDSSDSHLERKHVGVQYRRIVNYLRVAAVLVYDRDGYAGQKQCLNMSLILEIV